MNDIVKGLLGSDTGLAIIPKGSGNGMARTLSIPLNVEQAVGVINKDNSIRIDIAYANDMPFISNAGVAFDALISEAFAKSERRGLMVYSLLVTRHMWTYREQDWQVTIDGRSVREKAFIINIANGRQFGYGFRIAPAASWTDGLLDVIIVKKFPKIIGGLMALRLKRGTITSSPYVDHFLAKDIIIEHPALKMLQTDGDAHACSNRVHFRVEPAAIKVIVP